MKKYIFFILLFLPLSIYARIGGIHAFSFINLETSPRIEAMGGTLLAIYDYDLSLAQTTPSLLNINMDNELVFSFIDYFSDINVLGFSYAKSFEHIGTLSIGVKSITYGSFDLNDDIGITHGSFSVNDQVFTFGIGKLLTNKFSLGVNVNLLNSNAETYSSYAISANIAGTYYNASKSFTSTLLIKNISRQLDAYANIKEDLPNEIQLGISKELAHLPFRYHISYNHLNQFNIKSPYKLIEKTNLETGELEIQEESIAKTFLRHIVIGGELNPFKKNLFLRGGFNFQRRFDLSLTSFPAMVGFSWGVGFKIYRFRLDYSRSSYHLSGVPNNFSIGTNLSTFGI